jgi:hypothetical protein
MIAKEQRKIHRPDCMPENRSPLCYCQTRETETPVESMVWKDLAFESPEAYAEWLKKISFQDTPFFRNSGS